MTAEEKKTLLEALTADLFELVEQDFLSTRRGTPARAKAAKMLAVLNWIRGGESETAALLFIDEVDLGPLQVHDALIGESDRPYHMAALFKSEMEKPVELHGRQLVFPADVQIGDSWGDCKEISNEELEEGVRNE